jgi:hypothetical protein
VPAALAALAVDCKSDQLANKTSLPENGVRETFRISRSSRENKAFLRISTCPKRWVWAVPGTGEGRPGRQRKDGQGDDVESTARDSEVSGQPIRERLHELRHAPVIGFLEHRLVHRRSVISCGRPHGPLYAPIIATPLMLSQAELSLIDPKAT